MNLVNNLKIIVVSFFVILLFTHSKAEAKTVFVEMDTLMNQSLAGKSLKKQLDIINKNSKKNFEDSKKKLTLKKDKINSQKNILSKEEYEKRVVDLNKEFKNFQNDGNKKVLLLKSKRDKAMEKILAELTIILTEYSKKNELSFIIDQKNIIIGRADFNITKEILKLLNAKLKKVTLN
tara:strand:- start:56 stop:589 length:534 start_codon:yes stop_codon:yes gene_type:complete